MKKERRQELHQDDLSVQLEKVKETVKRNAAILTIIVVAAALAVSGVYWYRSSKTAERNQAWAALSPMDASTPPAELVESFESVARQQVSPAITRSAWLKTGAAALNAALSAPPAGKPAPDRGEMLKTAESAYRQVVDNAGDDKTALGQAMIGLGIVAESRGQIDEARTWYQRAKDEAALKETPLAAEAAYRLEGLAHWAEPVEFPPPAPAPAPVATTPGTFAPPPAISTPAVPETPADSGTPAADTTSDASTPVPTTQPAGD